MAFKLKLPTFSKTRQSVETVSVGSVPVIGRLPFNQQLRLLGGGVLISLTVGIVAAVLDYQATSNGAHYLKLSGDLVMLTQRVAKDAGSALQGKQTAIDGLPQARADVERILAALEKGDDTAPALNGDPRIILDKLLPLANRHLGYIKDVEGGKSALMAITLALDAGRKAVPLLHDELGQLSLSGEEGVRVAKLDQMLDRIDSQVNALLGGMVTAEHFDRLKASMDSADELLAGLDQSQPRGDQIAQSI